MSGEGRPETPSHELRREGDGLCCQRIRRGKGPFCRWPGKYRGYAWLTYCQRHRASADAPAPQATL